MPSGHDAESQHNLLDSNESISPRPALSASVSRTYLSSQPQTDKKKNKNESIVKSSRCLCITSGAGLRDVIKTASLNVRGQNCSWAGINKMDYIPGKNERRWGSLRLIKIGFPLWIT